MNKISCLGLLASLITLFSFSAESIVVVRSAPVLVARPAVSVQEIRIEDWCPANYPNDVTRCLDGFYVDAYPTSIIWGTYGRLRGNKFHHRDHRGGDHRRDNRADRPGRGDRPDRPAQGAGQDRGKK